MRFGRNESDGKLVGSISGSGYGQIHSLLSREGASPIDALNLLSDAVGLPKIMNRAAIARNGAIITHYHIATHGRRQSAADACDQMAKRGIGSRGPRERTFT